MKYAYHYLGHKTDLFLLDSRGIGEQGTTTYTQFTCVTVTLSTATISITKGGSTGGRGDGSGAYRTKVQNIGKRTYEEQDDNYEQEGQQQGTYDEDHYQQDHMATMAQAEQADQQQQRRPRIADQEEFEWGEFQPKL